MAMKWRTLSEEEIHRIIKECVAELIEEGEWEVDKEWTEAKEDVENATRRA